MGSVQYKRIISDNMSSVYINAKTLLTRVAVQSAVSVFCFMEPTVELKPGVISDAILQFQQLPENSHKNHICHLAN